MAVPKQTILSSFLQEATRNMTIPTTLDGVLQELKAAYPLHKTTPGIQVASIEDLDDGTPQFYAGIHIFPAGVASRKVVAKATAATSVQAMADAMAVWRNIIAQERANATS